MKLGQVLKLLAPILGLGVAFENFANIGFLWKQFVLAIVGSELLWISVGRSRQWLTPKRLIGFDTRSQFLSKGRILLSAFALALICGTFIAGELLLLRFYAINVELHFGHSSHTELWIQGSMQVTKKLVIQVPIDIRPKCTLVDPTDQRHRASTVLIDWNSSNPQIEIAEFVYPQRQGISCQGKISANTLIPKAEPPAKVLFPDDLINQIRIILIAGGILWIVSMVCTFWRLR